MILPFYKYHGAGNDFIILDDRNGEFNPDSLLVARLCDRHFGIGADGLILLQEAAGFDFGMKYYNSDGRESTMCGNGGRCLVAFADYLSLFNGTAKFMAIDGPHEAIVIRRTGRDYIIKLKMGDVSNVESWEGDLVINTGSPHLLRFQEGVESLDVPLTARPIRYHRNFEPDGINVNFIREDENQLFVRTYERGVEDETLSCGTGVTASALAYAFRHNVRAGRIDVKTLGGDLHVHFARKGTTGFEDIWLEGPVKFVFEGKINLDSIAG